MIYYLLGVAFLLVIFSWIQYLIHQFFEYEMTQGDHAYEGNLNSSQTHVARLRRYRCFWWYLYEVLLNGDFLGICYSIYEVFTSFFRFAFPSTTAILAAVAPTTTQENAWNAQADIYYYQDEVQYFQEELDKSDDQDDEEELMLAQPQRGAERQKNKRKKKQKKRKHGRRRKRPQTAAAKKPAVQDIAGCKDVKNVRQKPVQLEQDDEKSSKVEEESFFLPDQYATKADVFRFDNWCEKNYSKQKYITEPNNGIF